MRRLIGRMIVGVALAAGGCHEVDAQRTAKKAADWGKKMRDWSAKHDGGAVIARLGTRMGQVCPASDATAVCRDVLGTA